MSLTLAIILLLSLVVFITHALEAITGFGCTVLAFPFVIAITGDIGYSKIILTIIAWALALYFVITKFKWINWRQFIVIFGLAAVGLPIGIWIFDKMLNMTAPVDMTVFGHTFSMEAKKILTKALGVFIVFSAGVQLWKIFTPKRAAGGGANKFSPFNYAYLFFGGIVHGAFATGGPLVVLYSTKKLTDKGEFRATMCLLWTLLNTWLIADFFRKGMLTHDVGKGLLYLLPALALGIVTGEIVHHRVNELLFRKIVFLVLFAVGVVMVIY